MALSQRQDPSRVTLTNLNTNETMRAQFNPERLEEDIAATWNKLVVPGYSHQPLQFIHTGNESFDVELFWRGTSSDELEKMRQDRRFLKSLEFPRGRAETVAGGAAPRVLFVWPRMLSIVCVVRRVRFVHEEFNRYGQARVSRATVQLEEIRDTRLTSREVRRDTGLRYGHVPGGDIPAALKFRPNPHEGVE